MFGVFRTGFRRRFVLMVSVVAGQHFVFVYGFRRRCFNGFHRGKERYFMVSVVGRFLMVSGC